MKRLSTVLLLLCVVVSGQAVDGLLIDYGFEPRPPGVVAGILGDLLGVNITLGADVMTAAPVVFRLRSAHRRATMQALAHASAAWWMDDGAGGIAVHQSLSVPLQGSPRVQSYSSGLRNRHDLERVVRSLMAPWLGQPGTGLASLPWTGQWTATLDAGGHSQLRSLLGLLETDADQVPTVVLPPDLPDPQRLFAVVPGPVLKAATASALILAISDRFSLSVSIGPTLAAETGQITLTIEAQRAADAVEELRAAGLSAHWLEGVLCVDRVVVQRRAHPVLERRLTAIPIPHLAQRFDGNLVAAALRRHSAEQGVAWDQAGRHCLYISDPPRLFIAAEPEVTNAVLDALDTLERRGSLEAEP